MPTLEGVRSGSFKKISSKDSLDSALSSLSKSKIQTLTAQNLQVNFYADLSDESLSKLKLYEKDGSKWKEVEAKASFVGARKEGKQNRFVNLRSEGEEGLQRGTYALVLEKGASFKNFNSKKTETLADPMAIVFSIPSGGVAKGGKGNDPINVEGVGTTGFLQRSPHFPQLANGDIDWSKFARIFSAGRESWMTGGFEGSMIAYNGGFDYGPFYVSFNKEVDSKVMKRIRLFRVEENELKPISLKETPRKGVPTNKIVFNTQSGSLKAGDYVLAIGQDHGEGQAYLHMIKIHPN